ncbi:CHC2 zinc finger domain-containing protein [Mesobacillus subterraneus]|uniref:CHC2 zinc finger domain-containing protein n=1 Tax=Mesobacillus subterraneus TaxID=285983 RepID=UPI00203E6454|nr:CHC2 zinc finger domain-containing protein [Mesobacillus subterraneus]MCM3572510.1 CHC2 zinc finger domain-containing protein [Mesobacillus subterraneus]
MNVIEEIKKNISIVEALQNYTSIDLRKVNVEKKQFNIRCLWHSDKNPSLTIYNKSNSWKCHAGCGGGDVINLVSKALKISNNEAIAFLKKELGIERKYSPAEFKHYQDDKALVRGFENTSKQIVKQLNNYKNLFYKVMKQVGSFEELNEISDVYHASALIEKYLEELESTDLDVKIATVKFLKPLLQGGRINEL